MLFGGGMNQDKKKNLHMTNWDTLSKPKKDGVIGVRKFGLMNKALLAKQ
jgi:hypothetical protein